MHKMRVKNHITQCRLQTKYHLETIYLLYHFGARVIRVLLVFDLLFTCTNPIKKFALFDFLIWLPQATHLHFFEHFAPIA